MASNDPMPLYFFNLTPSAKKYSPGASDVPASKEPIITAEIIEKSKGKATFSNLNTGWMLKNTYTLDKHTVTIILHMPCTYIYTFRTMYNITYLNLHQSYVICFTVLSNFDLTVYLYFSDTMSIHT